MAGLSYSSLEPRVADVRGSGSGVGEEGVRVVDAGFVVFQDSTQGADVDFSLGASISVVLSEWL